MFVTLHTFTSLLHLMLHPLVQKLESLSLIDEAWLISGTLPANTHKNRSKDVLPCECVGTFPTVTSLPQLQCAWSYTFVQYMSLISVNHRKLFVWLHQPVVLCSHAVYVRIFPHCHHESLPPPTSDDPYRVRLTMFPGVEGSDYINSTYMDVSEPYTCTSYVSMHSYRNCVYTAYKG